MSWQKSILLLIGLIQPLTLVAKTVTVPVKLEYPILRQFLVTQLFTHPGKTAKLVDDPSGCNHIMLSKPELSKKARYLQISTKVDASLGMPVMGTCKTMLQWKGTAKILGQPTIRSNPGRSVSLDIVDTQLYSPEGRPLGSGMLWDYAKDRFQPLLNRFKVDLEPSIAELSRLLPPVLPRHSSEQLESTIDSLQMSNVRVDESGVNVDIAFQIDLPVSRQRIESALTDEEMRQWEKTWQTMDAFLTFVVKHYAAATELQDLRESLFDILLDSRHQLQTALSASIAADRDPVRRWFLDSWGRLVPVMRRISREIPGQEPLALISLVTAADALNALDQLGPAIGLDISIDGLRRLARLLNKTSADPLFYQNTVDPELLRLFLSRPSSEQQKSLARIEFNLTPIRSALADSPSSRLDRWVPNLNILNKYLNQVRSLLIDTARRVSQAASLDNDVNKLYQNLVMATAWQESCWRQFVVRQRKIVPLRSGTADAGLMQLNERVWRGFYDVHKLRWDVAYNVRAGSEVLLRYLTRYAMKTTGGSSHRGGLDNLARASYSAYNGGPGQISRYRNPKAKVPHRKIDDAFWRKYRDVKQGKELQVAVCLGGQTTEAPVPRPASQQPIKRKFAAAPAQTGGLKDDAWLQAQKENYYTLQLAVFTTRNAALAFIAKQGVTENVAVYHSRRNKHYGVTYGRFSNRAAADKAKQKVPGLKPWPRRFQDIQELISP